MKLTSSKLEKIRCVAFWVCLINSFATLALMGLILSTLATVGIIPTTYRKYGGIYVVGWSTVTLTSLGVYLFAKILLIKRMWDTEQRPELISHVAFWVFTTTLFLGVGLMSSIFIILVATGIISTTDTSPDKIEIHAKIFAYGLMTIAFTSLGVYLFAKILPAIRRWDMERQLELKRKEREQRELELKREEERRRAEKEAEAKRVQASYWEGIIGNGKLFEREFAALWEKARYKITERSSGPDQGVDFIAMKDEEKVVVQCKASKDKIGADDAIKLLGSVTKKEANRGVLASIGGFTIQAYTFAKGTKIELWGLEQIIELSTKTSSS